MTAPDTTEDPTLAEAFGELSEAIVATEEGAPPPAESEEGERTAPAPAEQQTTQPSKEGEKTEEQQEQQPGQPQQEPATDQAALPERQPLNYTVDGQPRAFEGGFIIPGHGAIISNEALPRLQDRLQQADRLVAQNQTLYN